MRRFWLREDEPPVSKIFAAESDLTDISALLSQLPAAEAVGRVRSSSFFQGILDLLRLLLAPFVGLFSGAKLADRLPGVWVFGVEF